MERIPEAGDVTSAADKTAQFDDDNLTGKRNVLLSYRSVRVYGGQQRHYIWLEGSHCVHVFLDTYCHANYLLKKIVAC